MNADCYDLMSGNCYQYPQGTYFESCYNQPGVNLENALARIARALEGIEALTSAQTRERARPITMSQGDPVSTVAMNEIQYCWINDSQLGQLQEIGASLDNPDLAQKFSDLIALVRMQRLQVHQR